jgi:predicted flap endonuclease-1-like 5' DNA nuclease
LSSRFLQGNRLYGLIMLSLVLIAIAAYIRTVDDSLGTIILGGAIAVIAFVSYLLYGFEGEGAEPRKPKKKKAVAKPTTKPEQRPKVTEAPKVPEVGTEVHTPEVVRPAVQLSELPIETIEGIGEVYGGDLRGAGIDSVQDLIGTPTSRVAEIADVSEREAEGWIAMARFAWLDGVSEEDAEAIVFATGIDDLKALARADANDLLRKILKAVESEDVRVPAGYEFTIEKVKTWIQSAKKAIR